MVIMHQNLKSDLSSNLACNENIPALFKNQQLEFLRTL